VLAALGEIVAEYMSSHHIPSVHILHIYTVLEFNTIALFYYLFFGHFYPRWLVPGLMVGFTGLAVLNTAFLQPLTGYNSYARSLEGVLIIGLALLCYQKMLVELTTKRLDKSPVFWINTGFLLYFAGNLFFFILGNALIKEPRQSLSFMTWGLHSLLMALMHSFIGVGLWFSPQLR
ncbi:MAG: hypothetical protein H7Z72_22070, partial [Bacteroidetes bacterium]|nr:hypothetical protein [Fibrella sp.]